MGAAGGLLSRRFFLTSSVAAGALGSPAHADPLTIPPWTTTPGSPFMPYGQPSRFEAKVVRVITNPASPGTGSSRTPHHRLNGVITPNGLHFERSHNGVPDIDPDGHRLLIHGMVKRALVFTLDSLARYPMETRQAFIECAGNSAALYAKDPVPGDVQQLHGLVSCAEWTGVKLSILLDEAGLDPDARWVLAEGADAAAMSRSVPLAKVMDDALVALYQNGERVRPSNGYPMRLLLPGYEGNMNVKWLRRLKVTDRAVMTKDETSKYTLLLADGTSLQFFFPIEAKSIITHPSPGLGLKGPGLYEVAGLAWSGSGKIGRVEVSADGGVSWAPAVLQEPVLPKALTRFRIAWQWDGAAVTLQSRAIDDTGYVQPTRAKQIAERGSRTIYHFNAIAGWAIAPSGEVKHVYV
jgi:sulfane dehydrogenase subunit SoxC